MSMWKKLLLPIPVALGIVVAVPYLSTAQNPERVQLVDEETITIDDVMPKPVVEPVSFMPINDDARGKAQEVKPVVEEQPEQPQEETPQEETVMQSQAIPSMEEIIAEQDEVTKDARMEAILAFVEMQQTRTVSPVEGDVVKPAQGVYTSGFGPRWGAWHDGIDIAAPEGTPIVAVMDGVVIDSGPASGFGNWIRIMHNDGSISVYGHMRVLHVTVGQYVQAGDHIADMGNEGWSTGSHLHFEIHPDGGQAIDPEPWLNARGIYL